MVRVVSIVEKQVVVDSLVVVTMMVTVTVHSECAFCISWVSTSSSTSICSNTGGLLLVIF
jgi:hypothetical protein